MILRLVANDDDEDNDLDEDDLELLAENTGVPTHRKAKVQLVLFLHRSRPCLTLYRDHDDKKTATIKTRGICRF